MRVFVAQRSDGAQSFPLLRKGGKQNASLGGVAQQKLVLSDADRHPPARADDLDGSVATVSPASNEASDSLESEFWLYDCV